MQNNNQIDEARAREIIREELHNYAVKNQYTASKIPIHNHDGLNSTHVDANTLEYSLPYFRVFQATTTPTSMVAGAIVSINNVLYISNGTSWIKVGSQ